MGRVISFAFLVLVVFLAFSPADAAPGEKILSAAASRLSFVNCNYTEVQGTVCQDCNTRLLCTPIGLGIVSPCWWPGLDNCVDGECVEEPSDECGEETTQRTTS